MSNNNNSGGQVYLSFSVKCSSVGFGQSIFLCRENEEAMSSGWGIQLHTNSELYPYYETKEPLVIQIPSAVDETSAAASSCFTYKYAIWEGGVFSRFENPTDSVEDKDGNASTYDKENMSFLRTIPLKIMEPNQEYRVIDNLGVKHLSFTSSNFKKMDIAASSVGSLSMHGSCKSLQRKSSSALMMMDRSKHGGKGSLPRLIRGNNPTIDLNSSDGVVVASAFLPVHLHRSDAGEWSAEWDYEALLSMSTHLRVTRVGTVKWRGWHGNTGDEGSPEGGVPVDEHHLVEKCLEPFNCVPVWCSTSQFGEMYNGFCKGVLWPILHNVTSVYADGIQKSIRSSNTVSSPTTMPAAVESSHSSFDSYLSQFSEYCDDDNAAGPVHGDGGKEAQLWHAYTAVNRQFAEAIVQCFHEGDLVWIHGFHLMLLPSYLTRRIPMAKVGLFLHTPFPSSEIFRTLWCREDLLRGMLNADQVGFHLYEYARHFLTCCRRLLGLSYGMVPDSYGGYTMAIDNSGRTVSITSIHAGIEPPVLNQILQHSLTFEKYHAIQDQFRGKCIMAAIDRLETLKGIPLKLLAIERFLQRRPEWVGKLVLIQIGISAYERGDDYTHTKATVLEMAASINSRWPGTIQFQECAESEMRLQQRLAILRAADICLAVPVRDGLNQIPLEFSFCHRDAFKKTGFTDGRKRGICILSEFASCSRIMRGALQVNPWKIAELAYAMDNALNMSNEERLRRIKISSEYVTRVTSQRWALAVLLDLKGIQKNEDIAQYAGAGLGLNFRLLGMDKDFVSLDTNRVAKSYKNSRSRLILLDYGGTILHNDNVDNIERFQMVKHLRKASVPTKNLLNSLKELCDNPRNVVFVVSGKERHSLSSVFDDIPNLGLAAEHGMFVSWPSTNDKSKRVWDTVVSNKDTSWRLIAISIMEVYTSRTHGSYIEETEMKVLWQYRDADPEFGYSQSKELEDHLSNVLRNYNVDILHGGVEEGGFVEVRPKGVNKGLLSIYVIKKMFKDKKKKLDFALVLGDDHCDEPMLSVMRQVGRQTELKNNPQQAHVSLPQLQVSAFDIEEVSDYIASGIETFTCTVGKKPTAAASYLNDVSEVHELLEAMNRISARDHQFYSSIDLRSLTGITADGAIIMSENRGINSKKPSVETITSGITRSMSLGALVTNTNQSTPVSSSLTQFLGTIGDEEEEDEDAFFF